MGAMIEHIEKDPCPVCGTNRWKRSYKRTVDGGRRSNGLRCLKCQSKAGQEWAKGLRSRVIAAYGGRCACCGETEPLFLTIDHVDGGGGKHRASLPGKSRGVYAWLIRNGFPEGFQVLCWNCNAAKGAGDRCPVHAKTWHEGT